MGSIIELRSEAEWRDGLSVLLELRPELDLEECIQNRIPLMSRGYTFFGLSEDEVMLCVAGVVIQPHITRGNDFWVHDLVTISKARSRGVGEKMMRFLEVHAKELGCSRLSVHTRLEREKAQNFYENHLGYERYAVVYQKEL